MPMFRMGGDVLPHLLAITALTGKTFLTVTCVFARLSPNVCKKEKHFKRTS
jgi:hypothetical protein